MGFSHRARSSSVRSVRRWIRIARSSAPLALSASGLIAGREAGEAPAVFAACPPCPEGVPEEGKRGVLVRCPAPTVLAVDDPRLVRVQPEPDLLHPRGDPAKHVLGLPSRRAVHDRGESPGGVAPPGARRTRREPLSSPGSHRPAVRAHPEPPVGEQAGLASGDVSEEPACPGRAAAQAACISAWPTARE